MMRNIFVALSAVLLLASCSGQVDTDSRPVLSAEWTRLDLACQDRVVLRVEKDGRDVTSSSVIRNGEEVIAEGVFIPQDGGVYSLVAEFDGQLSDPLKITVYHSAPQVQSAFEKRVCVSEFTGAWCVNCPDGYNKMMGILSTPSMSGYKDRVSVLAFHSDVSGTDTLAHVCTQDVMRLFPAADAFPSFAVDFRPSYSGLLADDGLQTFRESVRSAFEGEEYPVYCGVAVSSRIADDGVHAEITVKVKSEFTNPLSVVVAVVQDRIVGMQKTTLYPEGQDDYIHNHVVRGIVTSYGSTFAGEKMSADGFIHVGEEAVKVFTVALDDRWVLENMEVYAMALDHAGCVNNMNVCKMAGGDSGYALVQQQNENI